MRILAILLLLALFVGAGLIMILLLDLEKAEKGKKSLFWKEKDK